jgi:hypothetical protein
MAADLDLFQNQLLNHPSSSRELFGHSDINAGAAIQVSRASSDLTITR